MLKVTLNGEINYLKCKKFGFPTFGFDKSEDVNYKRKV